MTTAFEKLVSSAHEILPNARPLFAIQLGTGQSHSFDALVKNPQRISYSEFFASTPSALTHRGELILGHIHDCPVIVFAGRLHLYEGHSPLTVCQNVILAKLLGCQAIIMSNAAGALSHHLSPGEVVMINDHINLTGENPLINICESMVKHFAIEHAFVDMSQPYSPSLRQQLTAAASTHGVALQQCIYAGLKGPSLETSAERRMLTILGADTVGMSTVNEVIMSRYLGLDVAAFCTVTNMATGDQYQQADSIDAILHFADEGGKKLSMIINEYCLMRSEQRH